MSVVVYSTDLMVISTISGAAQQYGQTSLSVATRADFIARAPADAQIVFVDLAVAGDDVAGLVQALRSHAPFCKVLAFGPHVHEQLLADARAAGCDKVLTRGQLVRDLPLIFSGGSMV